MILKKALGLMREKISKMDIAILFLAVAVIAVGISPQL